MRLVLDLRFVLDLRLVLLLRLVPDLFSVTVQSLCQGLRRRRLVTPSHYSADPMSNPLQYVDLPRLLRSFNFGAGSASIDVFEAAGLGDGLLLLMLLGLRLGHISGWWGQSSPFKVWWHDIKGIQGCQIV